MRVWRLSRHASLDGAGGLKVSGRWHTRGQPILYCAANPASAILEQLVHQEIRRPEALQGYRMLEIEVPDDLRTGRIDVDELPNTWAEEIDTTRGIGDTWLQEGEVVALEVPSVIVPATQNILINPKHPDAQRLRLLADEPFAFDPRLLGP